MGCKKATELVIAESGAGMLQSKAITDIQEEVFENSFTLCL